MIVKYKYKRFGNWYKGEAPMDNYYMTDDQIIEVIRKLEMVTEVKILSIWNECKNCPGVESMTQMMPVCTICWKY